MKTPLFTALIICLVVGFGTSGAHLESSLSAHAASLVEQSKERVGFKRVPRNSQATPENGRADLLEHPGIRLRGKVSVSDTLVRLGDIFDGLESGSDIPVARAPEPGGRLVYESRALSAIAVRHNVKWRPATRFDRIIVTRESLTLGREAIEGEIVREMIARTQRGDVDVILDNPNIQFNLPTDKTPIIVVETLNHDERSGRFVAVVAAPAGDPEAQRLTVTGRAVEAMEIPVLNRRVDAGDVIDTNDIEWIRTRADRMDRNIVTNISEIVGYQARRPLNAGEGVRGTDIEPKVMIEKGALVSMILSTPQMTLTALGKAMEDGSMGEVIRVRNSISNRTISARVTGPDRVSVVTAANIAARQN